MWGQVSLEKALRAFLSGRTVKAVDLPGEVIRDLSNFYKAYRTVLKRRRREIQTATGITAANRAMIGEDK